MDESILVLICLNLFSLVIIIFSNMRSWRSWIARVTPTHKAAGSNPVGRTKKAAVLPYSDLFYFVMAQRLSIHFVTMYAAILAMSDTTKLIR